MNVNADYVGVSKTSSRSCFCQNICPCLCICYYTRSQWFLICGSLD